MRGAILYGERDVRFEDRPDPTIIEPTDAVIRTVATCVCGSDLWPYRGIDQLSERRAYGHEYVGIVEEVGDGVTSLRPGRVRSRRLLRLRRHLPALPGPGSRSPA